MVCSSPDLPITLATSHSFNTSLSNIRPIGRGLAYSWKWKVTSWLAKGTQWCPRGDWVITRKSHEVQMECLLYPGVTPVMGMLSQGPTGFALGPLCFGCRLLKDNYPLTEASLHSAFATHSQCIRYSGWDKTEDQIHFISSQESQSLCTVALTANSFTGGVHELDHLWC